MLLTTARLSIPTILALRGLSALIAAIVVVDAIAVGAPGLALLAVPFAVAAAALRRESPLPMISLGLVSMLFVLLGVNYAIANGFDAGWGDLLFAYAGTPAAAAIVILAVRSLAHRRQSTAAGKAILSP